MIRPYTPPDLPDLLDTWAAASAVAHPFLSEAFLAAERDNIPNIYLPMAETWVFESDDRVVGFIALIGSEVGAIFVQPTHQRAGVGRQLMGKAKERMEALEVEVFAANHMGQGFYEREGFQLIEDKMHEPTGQALKRLRWTRIAD